MARYIDVDKVLQELGDEPLNWTDSEAEIQEQFDYKLFKSIIESQPTADVVEVVRCKDCVFYYAKDGDCFHPKQEGGWNSEGGECLNMEETDFCSYGKRSDTDDR